MAKTETKKAHTRVEERVWSLYNSLMLWDVKERKLQKLPLAMMHPSEARGMSGATMSRMGQENLLSREIGPSYIERKWPEALSSRDSNTPKRRCLR
jgi:hypothetical protein